MRSSLLSYETVIVGGGPAGLATAIALAGADKESCVIEGRQGNIDKTCGEGLMPDAVVALEELGVSLDGIGRTFDGISYFDGDLRADGRFSRQGGRGVRRLDLHRRLRVRAEELGVPVYEGERMTAFDSTSIQTDQRRIAYRWLIGADGLRSQVRQRAGLAQPTASPRAPRLGIRKHFRVQPWSRSVEVYWQDGIEAYVTPIAEDSVGVAFLWRGGGARFEAQLARFPELASRLADADTVSENRGSGPLRQDVRRVTSERVALIGDASGYVDAITGEGLAIAFQQAPLLARAISNGELGSYERACRRLRRFPDTLTHALLAIEARPRLRRRFIATLARHPGLFDRLLAVHAREKPWFHVGLRGATQLTAGLLVRA